MKSKYAIVILIVIIFIASCTKEGPQGSVGAQGPAGPSDISSGLATVFSSQWTHDAVNDFYYVNLTDTAITQSVVNNGAVLYYISDTDISGNSYIEALPETINQGGITANVTCDSKAGIANINLYGATPDDLSWNPVTFRIVVLSAKMLVIHKELNRKEVPWAVIEQYIKTGLLSLQTIKPAKPGIR